MKIAQNRKTTGLPRFAAMAFANLAFLYAPIVVLIIFSFNASQLVTVWKGFSLHWYTAALDNDDLRRATINSLVVAFGAMTLSTLIALPAALALRKRREGRARKSAALLMLLPLLIPEIVIAVATLSFFALVGISLGLGNVLLAHVAFCVPFAYSPMRARLETISPQMMEAASDLYARPWQGFTHVTLPLLLPGLISGALLAFITSLDDFIITEMVAPPGAMTLPVYVYSLVRRGVTPEINAISSLLLAVSMAGVLCAWFINKRKPGAK
jgi:spermidine/putrescine transport system permease protein